MRITSVDIYTLQIPFEHPLVVPIGTLSGAENVVIKINTDSDLVGWGESSPFAPITGDTQDSNYAMAQQFATLIVGRDLLGIEARMKEINGHTVGEPSIRSAFDMALYDVAAKTANMPLYQFLGGEMDEQGNHREIRTDLTIGMQKTVEETLKHAKNIVAAGFDAIKMKVGRPLLKICLAPMPAVLAIL